MSGTNTENDTSETPEGQTLLKRCRTKYQQYPVALPILLLMLSTFLLLSAMQDLILHKSCLAIQDEVFCSNSSLVDANVGIQTRAARTNLYVMLCMTGVSIVTTPIIGSLCDVVPLHLALSLPGVPMALGGLSLLLQSVYVGWAPEWVAATGLLWGLSGGFMGLVQNFFAFATKTAATKERRIRMLVILQGFYGGGGVVGYSSVGYLKAGLGYAGCVACGVACAALCLLLTYSTIPRRHGPTHQQRSISAANVFAYYKDTMMVVLRAREEGRRRILHLLMVAILFFYFCAEGSMQITYYYLKASVGMSLRAYGLLQGGRMAANIFGILFLYPVLSRRMSEAMLGALGTLGFMASRLCIAAAPSVPWAFVSIVFETFYRMAQTAMRSLLAEQVLQEEQGRIASCMALADTAGTLLSNVTFNFLFPATIDVFLPTSWVLVTVLLLVPLASFGYIHLMRRRIKRRKLSMPANASSVASTLAFVGEEKAAE